MDEFIAFIFTLALGAFVGAVGGCDFKEYQIAKECERGQEFVVKHQRFTCSPTGEWVEEK